MNPLILALVSAAMWGCTDLVTTFVGRRIGSLRVVVIAVSTSVVLAGAVAVVRGALATEYDPLIVGGTLLLGVAAGIAYIGVFTAFRLGPLSVVSPTVSAYGALAAFLAVVFLNERLTLAHVGGMFDADGDGVPEPLYYNGFKAGTDVVGPQPDAGRDGCGHLSYAHKLGVENMAAKAIQGRAVLVDLEKHYGRDHKYVSYDDFKKVLDADKVVVEPGDMLLLYVGLELQSLAAYVLADEELRGKLFKGAIKAYANMMGSVAELKEQFADLSAEVEAEQSGTV